MDKKQHQNRLIWNTASNLESIGLCQLAYTEGCTINKKGTQIARQSFALPTGGVSSNPFQTIVLCKGIQITLFSHQYTMSEFGIGLMFTWCSMGFCSADLEGSFHNLYPCMCVLWRNQSPKTTDSGMSLNLQSLFRPVANLLNRRQRTRRLGFSVRDNVYYLEQMGNAPLASSATRIKPIIIGLKLNMLQRFISTQLLAAMLEVATIFK